MTLCLKAPETRADLTDDWTKNVCRIGQGAKCCRYLTCGPHGWDCEKHTAMGRYLDRRVATDTITAQGDNCPGLPLSETHSPPLEQRN